MPLRSPPTTPPRYDSSVERSPDPKHIFDRDPLLIPQLFADGGLPWYRRRRWLLASVVSLGAISATGILVARYGPRGAMDRVGHVGVAIMHLYTRIVAGGPSTPHH